MSMMVDYFNNVPYSEAALGSANFNPKRDSGRDVYEACYNLTNEAIALLTTGNAGAVALTTDIYYGGNMSKWLKFAHSLKLQVVVNSRLKMNDAATRFNSILADNNYITAIADDFQFNYNTTFTPDGDYRHPIFIDQYLGTPEIYLCKSFIDYMAGDPRRPYYFYRQTANGDNFARPHGNTQAIVVSDQIAMTVHGYFPYGGKFDDNTFGSTNAGMGLQGAGKNIFLSSYSTHFLIAEALKYSELYEDEIKKSEEVIFPLEKEYLELEETIKDEFTRIKSIKQRILTNELIVQNLINGVISVKNYLKSLLKDYLHF
jgi:hypothetical protein